METLLQDKPKDLYIPEDYPADCPLDPAFDIMVLQPLSAAKPEVIQLPSGVLTRHRVKAEEPVRGKILKVGPGLAKQDGGHVPLPFSPDQIVRYHVHECESITIGLHPYHLIKASSVVCIDNS